MWHNHTSQFPVFELMSRINNILELVHSLRAVLIYKINPQLLTGEI